MYLKSAVSDRLRDESSEANKCDTASQEQPASRDGYEYGLTDYLDSEHLKLVFIFLTWIFPVSEGVNLVSNQSLTN